MTVWSHLNLFLQVKDKIIEKSEELKELNLRASGEVVIRQALAELDTWEVDAKFTLVPHTNSSGKEIMLIKEWKDIINKVEFSFFSFFPNLYFGGFLLLDCCLLFSKMMINHASSVAHWLPYYTVIIFLYLMAFFRLHTWIWNITEDLQFFKKKEGKI